MLYLSITTPGFSHFYYNLGADLRPPLHGDVSVMQKKKYTIFQRTTDAPYSIDLSPCTSNKGKGNISFSLFALCF